MPLYFIDTDDKQRSVQGTMEGALEDVEEARRAALAALPDMARDNMPDGDRLTFTASVRDEGGRVLYTATLSLVGEWTIGKPERMTRLD